MYSIYFQTGSTGSYCFYFQIGRTGWYRFYFIFQIGSTGWYCFYFSDWKYRMVLYLFSDWQYWMVFFFYFTCIFRSAVLDGIFYIFYIFVLRLAVLDGIVLYFYIFVFRLAVLVLDGFVLYFIFRLAVLDGIEPESVVVKFFGIFFFFFQCNSIVGHMISTGGTSNKIYLLKQFMNNMANAFM